MDRKGTELVESNSWPVTWLLIFFNTTRIYILSDPALQALCPFLFCFSGNLCRWGVLAILHMRKLRFRKVKSFDNIQLQEIIVFGHFCPRRSHTVTGSVSTSTSCGEKYSEAVMLISHECRGGCSVPS